ncbi:hypothetical protein BGX26_001302 [Mortierella sp. AD094]|nr:hypothetical protein BGX26_001302 [Mortierella sp. AD094]
MTLISKKKTLVSNVTRLLSAATAVAVLSMGMVEASINCQSPTGTYQTGDSVSLDMGDNGWWPKTGDIYSVTATVRCSSGGKQIASFGTSNGGSWTIPDSAYGACPSNQMYVEYSGNAYDIAHLLHIWPYSATCGSLTVTSPPPPPPPPPSTTSNQPPPTTKPQPPPTQPPPTQPPPPPPPPPTTNPPPPTTTSNPAQPTTTPGTPPTTTPGTPPTTTAITTVIVVPTVISGTSTVITSLTAIAINYTIPTGSVPFNPSQSMTPGLPATPGGQNDQPQKSNTPVPVVTLAAVGGVAALMLIVFGLVVTRNRRRQRKEQMDQDVMEKHGFVYDPTMSNSADDFTLPSLHNATPFTPFNAGPESSYAAAGAAGMTAYGFNRKIDPNSGKRVSDQSNGASASGSATLLPFPVPSAASEALRQQYDLANRMSIASQDSVADNAGGPGPSSASASGAFAAAAAVNHQLSLKEELDREEVLDYLDTGSAGRGGYASARGSPVGSHKTPSSPSVAASVAPSTSAVGDNAYRPTHSSVYETAHSRSSDYGTAQSPSLSSASYISREMGMHSPLVSHDVPVPPIPTSSSHMHDLIRNVLNDD